MAIYRQSQPCYYCFQPMEEIHLDQSDVPSHLRVIGDTFLRHECTNKKCESVRGKKKPMRPWRKKETIPMRRKKRQKTFKIILRSMVGVRKYEEDFD